MNKKKMYKCPVCGEIMGQSIRYDPKTADYFCGYTCHKCNVEILGLGEENSTKFVDALDDMTNFVDLHDEYYNELLSKYTSTLEEVMYLQRRLRELKRGNLGFCNMRLQSTEEELYECGEALNDAMKKLDAIRERNLNLTEDLQKAYDTISDLQFNIESQKTWIKAMEADVKYLSELISKKNGVIAQLKQK